MFGVRRRRYPTVMILRRVVRSAHARFHTGDSNNSQAKVARLTILSKAVPHLSLEVGAAVLYILRGVSFCFNDVTVASQRAFEHP
jgi:hypothetical protein